MILTTTIWLHLNQIRQVISIYGLLFYLLSFLNLGLQDNLSTKTSTFNSFYYRFRGIVFDLIGHLPHSFMQRQPMICLEKWWSRLPCLVNSPTYLPCVIPKHNMWQHDTCTQLSSAYRIKRQPHMGGTL